MPDSVESILGIQTTDTPAAVAPPDAIVEPGLWSFEGRIGRASFWGRMIMLTVIGFPVGFVGGFLMGAGGEGGLVFGGIVYLACLIAQTWFALATQIKRWHDLDYTGWMVLLNFTIIGLPFILIALGCARGTVGSNKYGADPLPPPALSVT